MWGLSFKPETDDMRESTALVMIAKLLDAGCVVRVYDPIAMDECKRRIGETVTYCRDMYDAVLDADALLLLTEWKEFRLPGWGVIKKLMKRPLVIDSKKHLRHRGAGRRTSSSIVASENVNSTSIRYRLTRVTVSI